MHGSFTTSFLDTTHNRYSVSPSLSSLSDSVKQGLRDSLTSSGALNAIVLRFKMELIYTFSMPFKVFYDQYGSYNDKEPPATIPSGENNFKQKKGANMFFF